MGQRSFPTHDKLNFIIQRILGGSSDTEIQQALTDHGPLGRVKSGEYGAYGETGLRTIANIRHVVQLTQEQVREDKKADSVLVERRKEHWDRLADTAQKLHDELSIPDFQGLCLDDIQPGHLLSSLPGGRGWIYDWDKLSNEPMIRLFVEDINPLLFSGLLSHLKAEFSKFDLTGWKKEAGKLIQRWHSLATEISEKYVELTGMTVSKHSEAGLTPFLITFHCDWLANNFGHKREYIKLEVSPTSGQPALVPALELHPKGLPAWPLAYGDANQIEECQKATRAITDLYIKDPHVRDLANQIKQVDEKARELRSMIPLVVERRSFQGSCVICLPWGA